MARRGRWQAAARATGLLGADGSVRPTIIVEMSALAIATGSVNLGQGFPDAYGLASVRQAAAQTMQDGPNQYPPGAGIPELRRAVAARQRRH